MNKKIPLFIGTILLLLGFAATASRASSFKITVNTDWWDVSLLIRDALTAFSFIVCGAVLILRRSLRTAFVTLGGFIAAIGAYCIIAVIISVPIIFEDAPDDNSCGMGVYDWTLVGYDDGCFGSPQYSGSGVRIGLYTKEKIIFSCCYLRRSHDYFSV